MAAMSSVMVTGQVRRVVPSRLADGRFVLRVIVTPGGTHHRGAAEVHAYLEFLDDLDGWAQRRLDGAWVQLTGDALHALHGGTDLLLKNARLASPALTADEHAAWRRTGGAVTDIEGVPV